MVVSYILGGIGNQMFQYAAGRALALTNSQKHLLDLSDFSDYRLHHGFELCRVFNVVTESTETSTVHQLLGWRENYLARKVLRRTQFAGLRGKTFVVEPHFNYWPDFFNLTGDCYLYGYWQSELYFKAIESVIRQDFTFREPLKEHNAELALEMATIQAVSLHVRRGDYVSDPKNRNVMAICDLEYYRKAISYVVERVDCPVFYIFSDDVPWVKQNLSVGFPCVYVEHNRSAESYRDMQLMSLCRHHVIANSSFSWWGAWLNANPAKIVIAPKHWFRNRNDDGDLIPDEWVRL
ncbi:MAG: alpha-1,2-fucosyltransferase [Methylococcales bacterium]|nr:MAG: alpha-1,2-fucosyltransferase [Methylococcales bacterium]